MAVDGFLNSPGALSLARANDNVVPFFEPREEQLHLFDRRREVGVRKEDDMSASGKHAGADGIAFPAMIIPNHPGAWVRLAERIDDSYGPILTTVVNDNHLARVGLPIKVIQNAI